MTEERFVEILREYGVSAKRSRRLWKKRPHDNLDEARVRKIATKMAGLLIATDAPYKKYNV